MGIKVIEQSTSEREQEIKDIFNEIKPLLDSGVAFTKAVMKYKGYNHYGFQNLKWYKELRSYAVEQGYKLRK